MIETTDQQAAILRAALDLLAAGGPAALRVRDIAEAAGCTTMAVYSRFGGKDGVVEAIYVDGFGRFRRALETAAEGAGDRTLRQGEAYRRWALDNPGAYSVMFTEAVPGFAPSAGATAVALESFGVLVDAVEHGQSGGRIRPGDPTEIAWTLWGLAHGLVMLELANMTPGEAPADAAEIYDAAMTSMMRGLAPG